MNLNTVPKWDRLAVPFWDHMHSLVKEQKKSTFTVPFWDRLAVPKVRPQNRKIHSKGRFFSSGMADHALRLGPYMRRSCDQENFNMDTGGRMKHGKSKQTNHKPTEQKARRRSPSQICVSPSQRQQSKQRKGQEPNRNNHKRDLPRTQW